MRQAITICITAMILSLSAHAWAEDKTIHRSLDVPVKGYGMSFGNSERFTGMRFNVTDYQVDRVTGMNTGVGIPFAVHYDESMQRTNGINLGLMTGRAIEVNGANLGLLYTRSDYQRGLALSCLYSGAEEELTGVGTSFGIINAGRANGIQFGGVGVRAGSIKGIALGGLAVWSDSQADGLQMGLLAVRTQNTRGVQMGGLGNWAETVNGGQVTLGGNKADRVTGVQLGTASYAEKIKGAQVSFLGNRAKTGSRGAQLGAFNSSVGMQGFQMGLFNLASEGFSGMQFGLLNIIPENPPHLRFVPIINWHFKA